MNCHSVLLFSRQSFKCLTQSLSCSDPAKVLSNFRNENINHETTLTVVVKRKRVLQSPITALGKTCFAWHRRPQVEFVGELAEDHGGPTREFFRWVHMGQTCT